MTTPKWRKTTIAELEQRLDRGEWPRFRARGSGDEAPVEGRLLGDRWQGPRGMCWTMVHELPSLGVPSGQPEMVDLSPYADLELWTVDDLPALSVQAINLNERVEFELTEFGAQAWDYPGPRPKPGAMGEQLWVLMRALGASMSNGGHNVIEENTIRRIVADAKPSHRAYTLTDRTLKMARFVARASSDTNDAVGELALKLCNALMHAQGMPESDLRRMATWVRDRCSDHDLVAIADATLANLAVDAMPVGSVDVRDQGIRDLLDRAIEYDKGLPSPQPELVHSCLRKIADKPHSAAIYIGELVALEHAKARGIAESQLGDLADVLTRQPPDYTNPSTPVAVQAARPIDDYARAVTLLRESQTDWADRATKAERTLDGLSLALRRIEAISNGSAPSTVREVTEPMPVEVADALVSRLLSQFIEFGTVSDALASGRQNVDISLATIRQALDSSRARIEKLERELADAAKDRALVGATETLVRRMIDRLVETDPEWVDSLRKGGS